MSEPPNPAAPAPGITPEDRYLLSVKEAAAMLDISEDELQDLARHHQVPTHNLAGAFIRFKKKDIEELKIKWRIHRELFPGKERYFSHHETVRKAGPLENLADFWYFNDFYIICSALIAFLLYFILSAQ
ncbi:MAG TPA: helix-turn-helix domain-containing protein [Candidatus Eisenbacteria bacterium]|jgi:excisionase family DNA binding protein|nr:helix-turn-helix domain-containing protein [Candidatus Eisenbacteria bacterium]